jgi:L-malate glycosyltransferase
LYAPRRPQVKALGQEDRLRVEELLLQNEMSAVMARSPGRRHILISFYTAYLGFVAQNAALALDVPHVASVRGSDFHRHGRSPMGHYAQNFIAQHADWIATTSREQEQYYQKVFGRKDRISTIHNPCRLEAGAPIWEMPAEAKKGSPLRIVFDGGYKYKKGAHLLIDALEKIVDQDGDIRLLIFGPTDPREAEFWKEYKQTKLKQDWIEHREWLSQQEMWEALGKSHLYVSASLSEGCSNAVMKALGLGIPAVITHCGSTPEMLDETAHVITCRPGDVDDLSTALSSAISKIRQGKLMPKADMVRQFREKHSEANELAAWHEVIMKATGQGV